MTLTHTNLTSSKSPDIVRASVFLRKVIQNKKKTVRSHAGVTDVFSSYPNRVLMTPDRLTEPTVLGLSECRFVRKL